MKSTLLSLAETHVEMPWASYTRAEKPAWTSHSHEPLGNSSHGLCLTAVTWEPSETQSTDPS